MTYLNEEQAAYNALATLYQSNYKRLSDLKQKFKSWQKALAAEDISARQNLEKEALRLEELKINLILQDEKSFPALLKEIPSPPLGIYIVGSVPQSAKKNLAIVGTRKGTETGKEMAKNFAQELTERGLNIISGLALGIDAAAHRGALHAHGQTFAVLAHGLDEFYPRHHEHLAKEIIESGGGLISEYPPGTASLPYRFLERNRIISGLAKGVLLIEAPLQSGSLSTARFALEQNREVFVIPGPITHPNFTGSNHLIREGAELVTSPQNILEVFGISSSPQKQNLSFKNSEEETIFEILHNSTKPLTVDKIIEITDLDVQVVNKTLSHLLIKNAIKETEQGYGL